MKTRFSFEKRANTNLRQKLWKMKTMNVRQTDSFLVLYILFTLYRLAQHKIVLYIYWFWVIYDVFQLKLFQFCQTMVFV